jgi:photosystem II stability/assembly factor-like uncharacterized protein
LWLSALVLASAAGGAAAEPATYSTIAPLAVHSLLLDVTRAGSRLVAVGDRGHILLSDNDGEAWRQARVPSLALLTGVHFAGDTLGWAVGHDEVILRTTDGGENWARVHYAPEKQQPLLDVWFRDASHGIAVGAYGTLLHTSDGGLTWTRQPFSPQVSAGVSAVTAETDEYAEDFPADPHLNKIARSATGKLYLAAEAGHLFRSDDDGQTWTTLPSPYEGSFFGVLPLDGEALLAFGLRGHLFLSTDAGQSWTDIDTGTGAMLTDGVRLDPQTIAIVGLGGARLISDDGGITFVLHQVRDRKGVQALVGLGPRAILTAGEGGVTAESL